MNNEGPDWPEFDCRRATFPSDALSVKRLRAIFPKSFDQPDTIANGYTKCNFFFPYDAEEPDHLVRISELLSDERTIAGGAYLRSRDPTVLNTEDEQVITRSLERLEGNLQFFKLADSPETARLLIRQVEEQGERQARSGPAATR